MYLTIGGELEPEVAVLHTRPRPTAVIPTSGVGTRPCHGLAILRERGIGPDARSSRESGGVVIVGAVGDSFDFVHRSRPGTRPAGSRIDIERPPFEATKTG